MTLSSARRKCPDKKEETSKVSSFFLDKTGDATGNYPAAGIGIPIFFLLLANILQPELLK